jgi:hypothetical protein
VAEPPPKKSRVARTPALPLEGESANTSNEGMPYIQVAQAVNIMYSIIAPISQIDHRHPQLPIPIPPYIRNHPPSTIKPPSHSVHSSALKPPACASAKHTRTRVSPRPPPAFAACIETNKPSQSLRATRKTKRLAHLFVRSKLRKGGELLFLLSLNQCTTTRLRGGSIVAAQCLADGLVCGGAVWDLGEHDDVPFCGGDRCTRVV